MMHYFDLFTRNKQEYSEEGEEGEEGEEE
jgi:hypothetical protein